jgi:hypothetical protein
VVLVSHKSDSWTTDASILGMPFGPSLSLEAVDTTDYYKAMGALIKFLCKPTGGCLLVSLVLSDKS